MKNEDLRKLYSLYLEENNRRCFPRDIVSYERFLELCLTSWNIDNKLSYDSLEDMILNDIRYGCIA